MIPAGTYPAILHGLHRNGAVSKLSGSTIPDGGRFEVRIFNGHLIQLFSAAMGQQHPGDFRNVQVNVEVEVDPVLECNKLKRITRVKRIQDVTSDVVIAKRSKDYVEF